MCQLISFILWYCNCFIRISLLWSILEVQKDKYFLYLVLWYTAAFITFTLVSTVFDNPLPEMGLSHDEKCVTSLQTIYRASCGVCQLAAEAWGKQPMERKNYTTRYLIDWIIQAWTSLILYTMKIIDSPACSCGFVNENEFHFLLVCPLYNRPRVTLQNAMGHIAPFTLRTLLYGDDNLDFTENKRIITETFQIYQWFQ